MEIVQIARESCVFSACQLKLHLQNWTRMQFSLLKLSIFNVWNGGDKCLMDEIEVDFKTVCGWFAF